jgi:diacylglycerol kinase (CTP)
MKQRVAEAKVSQFFGAGFPIRLHMRTDLHLARKMWHMGMGLLVVFIYMAGMSRSTAVLILSSVLGFDLMMEMARLRIPAVNERVMRLWGPFMRSCEANRVSGIPFYLASMVIAIGVFPAPIAVLSILYLALGDPIASLFGILYGHRGARMECGKSVIGTLAGVATCAVVTLVFLLGMQVSGGTLLALTLVGGLAGGMAELLPFELDDNFTIPVISGFALWLSFILLGV